MVEQLEYVPRQIGPVDARHGKALQVSQTVGEAAAVYDAPDHPVCDYARRTQRLVRRAHSSASSSRSFPQKSSVPTTNVGAPKIPSRLASSVCWRSRAFVSGA